MRRPGARFRDKEGDGKVLAVGAVVVVILFVFAHRIGADFSAKQGMEKEDVLSKKVEALTQKQRICSTQLTNRNQTKTAEEKQLTAKNQELTISVAKVQADTKQHKEESVQCEAEYSTAKEAWDEEQRVARESLQSLNEIHNSLSVDAGIAVGKDAHTKLLIATLRKFARDHTVLMSELGQPLTGMAESPEYIEKLVQKWKAIDKEYADKGEKGPLSKRPAEILPISETELKLPEVRLVDRYDPDEHASKIFLLERDSEGRWKIPGWNKRMGTNEVTKQGGFANEVVPVTTLNKNLRVMSKYALCGIGHNITGFMFPNAFKRCDDCAVEYMKNYIETPMVQFCEKCQFVHTLPAFQVLCNGFQNKVQYGGLLFWRSRSRIRFKDRILDMAKEFYENTLQGSDTKVLAVNIPDKDHDCEKAQTRETLAFQKLLNGEEKRYQEISADAVERCNPPMGLIIETIESQAKKIRIENGAPPSIFISATGMTDEQWEELKKSPKLFSYKKMIHRYTGNGRATDTDAVDTMIMAWSDVLVVDRFRQKSVQVIENHMILNNLQGKTIFVW
eukprot:TRINITY_DN10536_c0_g1_i4.p1 TRINITY_DN10536_c0_g1~~TRINITY_DN10536_c0_g1_i4.p1  ORF type:complete len:581 (+),score=124.15 TRINITY_DN10536_c0_g1_i4:59-1744(+)